MPIYMDVHIVPGVKARDVAQAHRMDLLIQEEHQCNCITYWIDEVRETIFCLIEAPTKEAVTEMHGRSHGLIPNKIIEVDSSVVGSFLGRIYDPVDAEITEGIKVFEDPSFRVLLLLKTPDRALLRYKFGEEKAADILKNLYETIRSNVSANQGREVEEKRSGFIASFTSATNAVSCALDIRRDLPNEGPPLNGLRMAINGGEPIAQSDELFGDTIELAHCMCNISDNGHIVISSSVNELIADEIPGGRGAKILSLSAEDEQTLRCLFQVLQANWHDPCFTVSRFCSSMAMSKSQFYRKTMGLCGLSPVSLLKNFRLQMARNLMRTKRYNISEITFASGFSSPSYFTKCFKKQFGLLPLAYVDMLH